MQHIHNLQCLIYGGTRAQKAMYSVYILMRSPQSSSALGQIFRPMLARRDESALLTVDLFSKPAPKYANVIMYSRASEGIINKQRS